jgi:ubiquinone biosynthesis protein
MLKQRQITTPLVDPAGLPPVAIVPLKALGRLKTLNLVMRLLRFLFSIFRAQRIRREPPAAIAVRVRNFLEDTGGLWVKFGQLISLRIDLLPREMADELTQLQYHAYGFAPEIARQIVTETLGRPLEQVFDVFEDHPFAAASISQEHRAHLRREDVWVVVKVQRPDIVQVFERDLKVIAGLLRFMGRLPGLGFMSWEGMIRELQHIMREEIDYRYETANLRRMRKPLRKHQVYVPKVFEKYGGTRVIVMELVEGPLMSDYLRLERTDPARLAAWREENNIQQRKVGSRLIRSFFRQLFEDNMFHGDLHPGNIVLLRNNRFALIDLGTVGNLDANFVDIYRREALAIAHHDYLKAADLYCLMCDSIQVVDLAAFRARVVEMCRAWEARTHMRGVSYHDKSVTGGLAMEFTAVAREFKISPSWQFLRVGRAMATADASLNSLLGTSNPMKIMRRYFHESQARSLRRLRKQAPSIAMGAVTGAIESAGHLSASLRRQAIQFEGVQTRVAQVYSWLFRTVRVGLVLGGIALLYTYLHQRGFGPVIAIHPLLGSWGAWVHHLPHVEHPIALLLLILLVVGFFVAGRAQRTMARKTPRLPDGRLDH